MSYSKIEQALNDLKNGKLILVFDDDSRENECDLVGLLDFIQPQQINFMIKEGRGLLCTPISENIAIRHRLSLVKKSNSDGTNFSISIDAMNSTTGISTFERYETMRCLLQKDQVLFRTPGHVFPLIAKSNGLLERRGHTEAAIALAKLLNANEAAVIVEVVSDSGEMMREEEGKLFAKKHNLTLIHIQDIVDYIDVQNNAPFYKDNLKPANFVCSDQSVIPTKFGEFNIVAISNIIIDKKYVVVFKGKLFDQNNEVSRIHSACLTSEAFGSLRCDCQSQLDYSMKIISENNKGFILYTPDEGRGIGIFEKINAYALQDKGFDTFDANLKLDHAADERDFDIESQIYQFLNVKRTNLITNNPKKIQALVNAGIKVNRIGYWKSNKFNQKYISTKMGKFNHLLTKNIKLKKTKN